MVFLAIGPRGYRNRVNGFAPWRPQPFHHTPSTALSSTFSHALGALRPLADFEANREARPARHIDQCVKAELVDAPAHQVIQPRLRQAQTPGGRGLADPPALDFAAERDHQFRPRPHIRRLRGVAFQRIPDAGISLSLHGFTAGAYGLLGRLDELDILFQKFVDEIAQRNAASFRPSG